VAEEWTATIKDFSADQKDYVFTVQGTRSGSQGSGHSGQSFVSTSGNLEIEPDDWMVERAWEHTHVALHGPFQVSWSVSFVCGGEPETIDRGNGSTEYRYVLATGLADTQHSMTIQGAVEDFAKIDHLNAYRPRISKVETVVGW
jgi:hypothetical protein